MCVCKIPGPRQLGWTQYWQSQALKYPRLWRAWFGPLLYNVTVNHPDTVKAILKTTEPKYTDRSAGYFVLKDWLGMVIHLQSSDNATQFTYYITWKYKEQQKDTQKTVVTGMCSFVIATVCHNTSLLQ